MPEELEQDKQEFRDRLEAEGQAEVRHKDSVGFYWRPQEQKWAREWLREHEKTEEELATERQEAWYANLILILVAIIGIVVAFILAR